jgi:hypothetical protein
MNLPISLNPGPCALVFEGGGAKGVVVVVYLIALYALRGTLLDSGWGVLGTYAAGPGAPRWAGAARGDWVLRVPVPKQIGTLNFGVCSDIVRDEGVSRELAILPELLRKVESSTEE